MPAPRLYVGTIGEGLWRSTNAGDDFVRACDGMFVECHVRAIVCHPDDPRVLYVGTEQGLFVSRDGADHWEQIGAPFNGLEVWAIQLLAGSPETILVGTCPSRLFRTDDGGRTWAEPEVQIRRECPRIMRTRVTSLCADPVESNTVWAGVEIDAMYRSADRGRSWEARGEGLSSRDIHALAVIPGNGHVHRILASTNNDLNLSTDDGHTWQPLRLKERLPLPYFRGMTQLCGRPEVLLLGNGDAPPGTMGLIARSEDGGITWREAKMPAWANSTIWNFAVHPANPELVYASSVSGEVYCSTDSGLRWEKVRREFGEIRALAWTP